MADGIDFDDIEEGELDDEYDDDEYDDEKDGGEFAPGPERKTRLIDEQFEHVCRVLNTKAWVDIGWQLCFRY